MSAPEIPANARVVPPRYDRRGSPHWPARLSPPDDTFAMCLMVPDRIIPVIFVPGVMGSNLIEKRVKPEKAVKWRLDDSPSAAEWMFRGAAIRKNFLRPEVMVVDKGGAIPEGTQQHEEELRRRGWGEIGAISYAPALVWLENALNDYDDPHNASDAGAGKRVWLISEVLGATAGEARLNREEVALSYRYSFPVHAFGYNWLDSNANSAAALGKRIDEVIRRYRDVEQRKCEKVILVTHSMGGLVARHCSEVGGYRDKIFGIVHGVMPAIGAAAVYRRMKAGTENAGNGNGVAAWLKGGATSMALGPDAAAMTAVLSTAPGPLQLLPTPEYGNGWLQIDDRNKRISLPANGDPYGEIYTARGKWWSLCEDQLMNPLNKETNPRKRKAQMDADWAAFKNVVERDVLGFHASIAQRYHPTTYAFYGSSREQMSYGNVHWRGIGMGVLGLAAVSINADRPLDVMGAQLLDAKTLVNDYNQENGDQLGTDRLVRAEYADKGWFSQVDMRYSIEAPDEPGDGTVPRRSGVAPGTHCKALLQVAVGHEPAYKPEEGADNLRACRFTLRSIVQIAQAVQQTSLKYE